MEPRPRLRRERREHGVATESAKRSLMALFLLTSQACDPFGENEEYGYRRGHADAQSEARDAAVKELQDNSPEVLKAKSQEAFKAKLVELEKAGYTVEISGLVISLDASTPLNAEQIGDISMFTQDLGDINITNDATDPLSKLETQLKPDITYVDIPIYQLHLSVGKAGVHVEVENWLTGESLVVRDMVAFSNQSQDYEAWQAKHEQMVEEIKQKIKRDKAKLAEVYGKLLTDHGVSLNAMDIVRTRPGNGLEQIATLFDTEDVSNITFNGFKHDMRSASSPFTTWSFDSYHRSEMGETGTPEMAGTLTSVGVYRYSNSEFDGVPDWWNKRTPAMQTFKDQYGNLIIVETSATPQPATEYGPESTTYTQHILISVPTEFLQGEGTEADWKGWNVDLTNIGLPELDDIIYTHPEKPVAQRKDVLGFEFNYYYQGDDTLTKDIYEDYYSAVESGVTDMQLAFYGYDLDQQLTSNVLIVPTGDKNGYFTARNSTTIALTDVHMRGGESNYAEVKSTARHETSHALFNHLNLQNNTGVTELHKRLSKDFFKTIDESNWETNGFGGHSDDNPTEFFASFMNGIMEYKLEEKLRSKLTPATAAEYADAAKTLREVLTPMLRKQNSPYETLSILTKLTEAETIAREIAAGT